MLNFKKLKFFAVVHKNLIISITIYNQVCSFKLKMHLNLSAGAGWMRTRWSSLRRSSRPPVSQRDRQL